LAVSTRWTDDVINITCRVLLMFMVELAMLLPTVVKDRERRLSDLVSLHHKYAATTLCLCNGKGQAFDSLT